MIEYYDQFEWVLSIGPRYPANKSHLMVNALEKWHVSISEMVQENWKKENMQKVWGYTQEYVWPLHVNA